MHYVKSHELPSDDRPAVYLVRDGRDAYVSYAHYILAQSEEPPPENYSQQFRYTLRDLMLYEASFSGWRRHVLSWADRCAPTAILRFEDLVLHPHPGELVVEALARLGRKTDPADAPSEADVDFATLHSHHPDMYRRGDIGGWKDEMPAELEEFFWLKNEEAMTRMGYCRKAFGT